MTDWLLTTGHSPASIATTAAPRANVPLGCGPAVLGRPVICRDAGPRSTGREQGIVHAFDAFGHAIHRHTVDHNGLQDATGPLRGDHDRQILMDFFNDSLIK